MKLPEVFLICCNCLLLAACGLQPARPDSSSAQGSTHSLFASAVAETSPEIAAANESTKERYSVAVSEVPLREVLFALAHDAGLNLDLDQSVGGNITLNAIRLPLSQILERLSRQAGIRYELDNGNLSVMPDTPYLEHYPFDYVSIARDSDGAMSNAMHIGSSQSVASAGSQGGNNSQLTIHNVARNHLWDTLIANIRDILGESDAASMSAAVIANPESGIISVRATKRQHSNIREFIEWVMIRARKQVLIEATVVEVHLSDQYQQGINWSKLRNGDSGFELSQSGSAGLPATNTGSLFVLDYANPFSDLGSLGLQISLLESFGRVKVLSSPKLSVVNNQTAMLRVVDNLVYFTIKADTTTNQTSSTTTYTTTPNVVPIGFTMNVTPQIDDQGNILLNLRPSISRLLGYVNDPNPALAAAGMVSRIPQTQTREMESVLQIGNGQVAVMGGLMQDETNKLTDAVPLLSKIPLLGRLFSNRNDINTRTELVIFLRPTVLDEPDRHGTIRKQE